MKLFERIPLTHYEQYLQYGIENNIFRDQILSDEKSGKKFQIEDWFNEGLSLAGYNKTMIDFGRSGKKIFKIEEGLFNELILTDINNLDCSFVKTPYDTICLHVPHNTILKYNNLHIKWIYINTKFDDIYNLCLVYIAEGSNSQYSEKYVAAAFHQLIDGRNIMGDKHNVNKSLLDIDDQTTDVDRQRILIFAMAAMLYINSDNTDTIEIVPRVLFKNQDSKLPMCSLGRNIIINKDFQNLKYDKDGQGADHRTRNVLKWSVRGHFHTYWYGKGRTEKRLKWVAPFLKGTGRKDEEQKAKPTEYVVQ